MAPKTRSGKPLKHLGRGYFVLMDRDYGEVSDRAPGEVWLAIEGPSWGGRPMELSVIMHPDSTDSHGMVVLSPRAGTAAYFATCIDDVGPIVLQPTVTPIGPHHTFNIDWNPMLDVMA